MAEETVKYLQTTLTPQETKALKVYLAQNEVPNQRQWLRELVLETIGYKEESENAE